MSFGGTVEMIYTSSLRGTIADIAQYLLQLYWRCGNDHLMLCLCHLECDNQFESSWKWPGSKAVPSVVEIYIFMKKKT
jgi:hypothetical protein